MLHRFAPTLLLSLSLAAGCAATAEDFAPGGDGKADGLGDSSEPTSIPVYVMPGDSFTTSVHAGGVNAIWIEQGAAERTRVELDVGDELRRGYRPILDTPDRDAEITVTVQNLGVVPLDGALEAVEVRPALLDESSCLSCHAIDHKLVGPSFQDIAEHYAGEPAAESELTATVKNGGSGSFGSLPMPPNSDLAASDRREMVRYILGLP